jgi:hypothetical protein
MKRIQALTATAAVALMAAACGGTGSGGAPNSSASDSSASANSQLLAYAGCMRSHGVPTFPDPTSTGFNKATLSQLAASNPQFQPANEKCAHLLPSSGSQLTQAQLQQWWTGMASFARCMRAHGMPDWPDPTSYPPDPSQPTYNLPASIQPTTQVITKMDVCLRLVPNNQVLGHIDNSGWESAEQQMAGQ